MRFAVWGVLSLGGVVALALPVACTDDRPTCYEGDFGACTCADARPGYRACLGGAAWAACVCDGTTPGLDGSFEDVADVDAAPPSKLPFMSVCTTNEECESGDCHLFSQKGSFCTKPCKETADCPAPSTGCNNRGICKSP